MLRPSALNLIEFGKCKIDDSKEVTIRFIQRHHACVDAFSKYANLIH